MNMNGMNHTMNGTSMPGMGTQMPGMGTQMPGMGTQMPGMGSGHNGMHGMDGGMPGMPGMMMMMYFHTGIREYILFEPWQTEKIWEFALACVGIFFTGIFYEVIKWGREEIQRRHNVRVAQILLHGSHEDKAVVLSTTGRLLSQTHVLQTLLHAVQIFISYCLMLVFMTYNAYLCVSLILGATVGYFITGWSRTTVTDQNEHCH